MDSFEKQVKRKIELELNRVNELIAAFRLAEDEETLVGKEVEREKEEDRWNKLGELIERASALEEALSRLARGTFGKCIVCEQRIGREAIEVCPEVGLCWECQALLEKARPPESAGAPRRRRVTGTSPASRSPRGRWTNDLT